MIHGMQGKALMIRYQLFLSATALLLTITASASAALVLPTSYDMPNGHGTASRGTFNYWDRNYSGSGSTTTDGALLSGGLGDLTDGVIASNNWDAVENDAGTGPFVGWIDISPMITFNFSSVIDFATVRIHFDDADGRGGVSTPLSVDINSLSFNLADPAGSSPFFAEFDVSGLAPTNQLKITLNRRDLWVFASEFQFTTDTVPEPSSLALMAVGGALMLGFQGGRRKKNRAAQ
jgi:PEP-CTERM motif